MPTLTASIFRYLHFCIEDKRLMVNDAMIDYTRSFVDDILTGFQHSSPYAPLIKYADISAHDLATACRRQTHIYIAVKAGTLEGLLWKLTTS